MANPIDSQLKSLCRLSLEDISLKRVAVLLLSDPTKYMSSIPRTVGDERHEERVAVRDELFKSAVAELGLPESISRPLINIMHPIFLEIIRWLKFHEKILISHHSIFYCPEYIKYLHWTNMGTVNYRKTAEVLIHEEKLNIDRRFVLACIYCLEKDIQDLWRKLRPLSKEAYDEVLPSGCAQPRDIVTFWACILKGRVNKLNRFSIGAERRYSSVYQYAFESFAGGGYEAATQYFFEKLTSEEKEASFVRTAEVVAAKAGYYSDQYHDILCYLLSQMNAEQLQNFLENSALGIVCVCLDWPRQDALSEVAKLVLPYLGVTDYILLHSFVSQEFKRIYNAPKVFRDLFLMTVKDFKYPTYYLKDFIESKNTEIIRFIFRNMDPSETFNLFFNALTMDSCYKLVREGEWDFLEFFIRESGLSKEDKERFAFAFNSYFAVPAQEMRERFTKMVNDISAGTSNSNVSNCSKVKQADRMDVQASGQSDEELIVRPSNINKKI